MPDDTQPNSPQETPRQDPVPNPSQPVNIQPQSAPAPVVPVEVEPTTAPAAASADTAQPPFAPAPVAQTQRKSKKKFVIGGIIAAILVLLIGGGALAYVMMRQSPQSILGGAIASLYEVRAVEGEVVYESSESDESSVRVKFSSNTSADSEYDMSADAEITFGEHTLNLKGDAAYDKDGNGYFKLAGLDELLESFGAFVPASATSLVDKYNDKWVKVSASDLRDVSDEAEESQQCFKELNRKLQDSQFKDDVEQTYRDHQFIVITNQLPKENGNVRYEVGIDRGVSESFGEAFEKTESFKSISDDCRELLESDSDRAGRSTNGQDQPKVTLTISEWSHELQRVDVVGDVDDDASLNLWMNFDRSDDTQVTIPRDTIPFSELQRDIESLSDVSATADDADDNFDDNDDLMINES